MQHLSSLSQLAAKNPDHVEVYRAEKGGKDLGELTLTDEKTEAI